MSEFSTYGHGLEDTSYGTSFDTVENLNAAVRELDAFYNIPTGWHYYPDSGLEVAIFMPRKAKATTFRVNPCTPNDAAKLDRAALWLLVRGHLAESRINPGANPQGGMSDASDHHHRPGPEPSDARNGERAATGSDGRRRPGRTRT